MFLFRLIFFIFGGLIRVGFIIFIGLCILNSAPAITEASNKKGSKLDSELFWTIAEKAGAEARFQLANAVEELGKYQIVVVKHER